MSQSKTSVSDSPVGNHESGPGWWNESDYAGTLRAEGENRPSRPSNVIIDRPETICVQGSVVGRKDKNGPGGMGWKVEEAYTVTTFDPHAVVDSPTDEPTLFEMTARAEPDEPDDVESLTPWPEMGEAMRVYGPDGSAPSLKQHSPNVLLPTGAIPIQDTRAVDKQQNGVGVGNEGDPSFTLDTASRAGVAQPEPFGFSAGNSADARSLGEEQGVAPPIRAAASGTNQAPTVGPVAFDEMNFSVSEGTHHVLRAGTKQSTGVVQGFDVYNQSSTGDTSMTVAGLAGGNTMPHALAPSLTASNDPSRSPQSSEVTQQVGAVHSSGYGVRRLTPMECERLQGFPDGWTDVPGTSDSSRYKAMGNAVTVNTVRWVLGMMLAADEQAGS